MTSQLSVKENKRINQIVNGNLWKTVLILSLPLAIYEVFNYLYSFIDLWLVSGLDTNLVISVSFINEIRLAVTAFGGSLAAAGAVIVAKAYASNQIDVARKNAAQTFLLTMISSGIVILIMILFGEPILRFFGANNEIIENGLPYYQLQMITTFFVAINSIFIGMEKAKGNTKNVLYINLAVMLIKLAVSYFWVKSFSGGLKELAISTLISQILLMVIGLLILFNKKITLHIDVKELKLERKIIIPILVLALPIFLGKFLFNMGKVLINGIALQYHPYAVAALSICGQVFGLFSQTASVLHDSEMSIVSQNLGQEKTNRAIKTYMISLLYALIITLTGLVVCHFLLDNILSILGDFTQEQLVVIKTIYKFEQFSLIFSAVISVVSGLFIGFKKTKVVFWINIMRVIIFRLPILWLMFTFSKTKPYWHVGFVMLLSNSLTAILALIFAYLFIRSVKIYGDK